ncbi:FliO/MopB family protein [Novosphingobium flavum]|uniref:FliO/MopB family protein n=1 Tax=Novosphingobium aerophilum TaxID=2839843 RepID=A0A7X1KCC2_9SPHN|nr:flagellar biosynthetic protein FliO [Novosphingobium aerophilum]MBC2652128.1 FliO/MopB family protein [Novosphingobium aerophilum]MBC2661085.1 FliO/MopB family protein [Novosphingobium aerophilum]
MLWYIVKLFIVLPLIGALIWGTLKLLQKMQARYGAAPGQAKSVRIIETTMLSPTLKLAVIEFHGREILVSASRHGLTRLAEAPARSAATAIAPATESAA